MAQQLEQQQQLQRARAAPWDPAVRVEVGAKFASMPTRTAVHTRAVNSTPGTCDTFHLIRFTCQVKGLFTRVPGHMGHIRALEPRGTRSNAEASFSVQVSVRGFGRPRGVSPACQGLW
ncbi:hypothetical protein GCM10010503_61940 [Streptomyces lucensis JCM 4490]|uniref:Uncharacterized protein n=1 Tax=Streptomyces lucensis JCM 4490 TaxID=1306176 RepID=A0A918JDS5_9ACTN|nr:hypothetical protein GCM10010503_61940 [Streptomyces lucensis JCM 4490]